MFFEYCNFTYTETYMYYAANDYIPLYQLISHLTEVELNIKIKHF
jgi:hypothetical protein